MVRVKPFLWGIMLIGVWMLTSFDTVSEWYGGWMPYFMKRAELEKSVSYAGQARDMVNPGKIWVDGDNIYVVERYKGVHIIDNSDPVNPVRRNFIVVPGCMDVAIKSGIIYLDNAVDLVAFDLAAGVETQRLKNYFPEPASPQGDVYHHSDDMILVGWKQPEKTEGRQ